MDTKEIKVVKTAEQLLAVTNGNIALERAKVALELTSVSIAGIECAITLITGDYKLAPLFDHALVVRRATTVIRAINDKRSKSDCLAVIREFQKLVISQTAKITKQGNSQHKSETSALIRAMDKYADKTAGEGLSRAESDADFLAKKSASAAKAQASIAKIAALAVVVIE